jgi:hypothetical protein
MATILVGRGGIGKAIMQDLERHLPNAMAEATRMLGQRVKYAILRNTEMQRTFEGQAFPALSAKYADRKARRVGHSKANLRYKKYSINRVKEKVVQQQGEARYAIQFPDRRNEDGELVPIFLFHEQGTFKMPRRKMLPESARSIPSQWEDEIMEIINKHLGGI